MKEVEIKVKIENLEEIKTKLEKLGFVFSSVVTQNDTIFTDPETAKKFDTFVSDVNFLRIREQGDKNLFTLKRSLTGELDCIERELEFNDKEQMKDIIKYLGYEEVIKVNKTRSISKKGDYELSLDSVEGLGDFLEVEHMVEMDIDSKKAQENMWKFLSNLGLNQKDEVTRGYDTLIYLLGR
jgi:adenylate cyclase class 2